MREDGERVLETQRSLPPALPPEAIPVEVDATAARDSQKSAKTRVAVGAGILLVFAVELAWVVTLGVWMVRVLW